MTVDLREHLDHLEWLAGGVHSAILEAAHRPHTERICFAMLVIGDAMDALLSLDRDLRRAESAGERAQ